MCVWVCARARVCLCGVFVFERACACVVSLSTLMIRFPGLFGEFGPVSDTHEADTFDTQLKCLLDRRTQLVRPRDELHTRILDAAVRINKREDQLRRTTRDLRTRVEKCTEVDGGIFERLL